MRAVLPTFANLLFLAGCANTGLEQIRTVEVPIAV